MGDTEVSVRFDEDLWFFLAPRNRRPVVRVPCDATSTIGHLVEALGVPLTEIGSLVVDGRRADASWRPADGDVAEVGPVTRPTTTS